MEVREVFLDRKGHLRSGWRVGVFVIGFYVCVQIAGAILFAGTRRLLGLASSEMAHSQWSFVTGSVAIIISALLMGWLCGRLFERLPLRALGCLPQSGWLRNLIVGSVLGAVSLFLAALLAIASRGIQFKVDRVGTVPILKTLLTSLCIFLLAAAAEELLFRGYPLQTLTRANLTWLGVLLTSVPFALAHLNNPNVVPGFTMVNTALAGVWLAVAYLRTRSLWLPFGLHWSWNWAQAFLLGLPVSGNTRIAPAPLLHALNAGPDWLTGGAYGIEGGAACTIALSVSTLIIWRTKLIARDDVPETQV